MDSCFTHSPVWLFNSVHYFQPQGRWKDFSISLEKSFEKITEREKKEYYFNSSAFPLYFRGNINSHNSSSHGFRRICQCAKSMGLHYGIRKERIFFCSTPPPSLHFLAEAGRCKCEQTYLPDCAHACLPFSNLILPHIHTCSLSCILTPK